MLAIFLHPFTLAVVLPVLIIAGIVVVLRPKGEIEAAPTATWTPIKYEKSQGNVYSSKHAAETRVDAYGHYDVYETRPVGAIFGEEMERQMIARVIAFEWLYVEGQKQKTLLKNFQNNLALCA